MALGSTNVTITQVKNILGESSNVLSTLCKSSKINMWSKWKPINYTGGSLTNTIIENNRCGLNIIHSSSIGGLIDAIDAAVGNQPFDDDFSAITYNRPTSNYRLGDFRNYNHSALEPESTTVNGDYPVTNGITLGELVTLNYQIYDTNSEIKKSNLYPNTVTKSGIYLKCANPNGGVIYNTWYTDYLYGTDTYLQQMFSYANEYQGTPKAIKVYLFFTNATKSPGVAQTPSTGVEFWALPHPIDITSIFD